MELVGGHFLKIREISSFNYYIRGCYLESFPILCTDIMETVRDFIFLGSKITADGDCSQEIEKHLSLEGKLWQI